MFKLFRTMRLRLIKSHRASRYLLYAFGEIILVVIGILIALQVNNWNEYRKNNNKERVYLAQLYKDIEVLKRAYSERLSTYPEYLNQAFLGLQYVKECGTEPSNKVELDSLLMTHQFLSNFLIINDTYNEMLSANVLASIENKDLKNAITDMYSTINSANKVLEYFRADLGRASSLVWKYVTFGYDRKNQLTVDYDIEKICQENEFQNALVEVVDSREDYLFQAQTIYERIEEAHQLIRMELNTEE